jgi:hypothetical protein
MKTQTYVHYSLSNNPDDNELLAFATEQYHQDLRDRWGYRAAYDCPSSSLSEVIDTADGVIVHLRNVNGHMASYFYDPVGQCMTWMEPPPDPDGVKL